MKANIIVETKHFVGCIDCGKPVGTIDHLKELKPSFGLMEFNQLYFIAGPWHCNYCGTGNMILMNNLGEIYLEKNKRKILKTLVLLASEAPVGNEFIYFVIKGNYFLDSPKAVFNIEEAQELDSSFYNEHTCPSNWLNTIVFHGTDNDPHGVFTHVKTIRMPTAEEAYLAGIESHDYDTDLNEVTGLDYKARVKLFGI